MNLKTNVTECKLKVKLLHEKLLEGKCETQIDEFLKKLLIYLWWEDTEDVDRILSIVSEWIVAAVMQWSSSRVTLPTNLISFTLKLAALLLKNENRFNHFNRNNFFIKLVNLSKARQPETDSAVKSAYIEFLSSFLDHQSGVEWIIASNYWEDIFHIYLNNANESLVKESTLFLEKILVKTVDFDEIFCENVIKRIMVPLGENIFRCVKASEDVSDEVAVELLQPILKLMVNLLESLLKGVCFEGKDLGVVLLFLKNFHLEERICDFMIIAQKQCLVLDITKIMFLMQFLELYGKIITKSTTLSKVQDSVARIQKNFITKLHTGSLEEKVDFCDFGLFYWKLMESKIPFCYTKEIRKDEAHFTDQLVFCLMMPGCCVLIKYLICSMTEWEEMFSHDDFRDSFVQKMFNLVSTDFTRVLFSWRESLMNCQDIFEICVLSLELIKKSSNYLSRNQAVMVFQCYIYFLNDVILVSNKFPEKLNIFVEKFSYLVEIFKIVGFLIENFQIVLKDGIEATYVLATCFDFLGLTEWPWQVMAQVLKLIDIATAHYMSPNMALLVENTTDSTVALLGPLLYSKIIDKTPEVKKAALEVVCTAAGISSNKVKSSICIFKEWIFRAVTTWNTSKIILQTNIVSFILSLAGLLLKNEERFNDVNHHNFLIKLIGVTQARESETPNSIHLAYINLLSSFLEHKSGIEWIVSSNFWEDIFELSLKNKNDDVIQESTQFLKKILDCTIDHDERFCDRVVKRIMFPLGENVHRSIKVSNDVSDEIAVEFLHPVLKLIGSLLEKFLKEMYLEGKNLGVVLLFLKNFYEEERICDFMAMAQKQCLLFDLSKVMFMMQFIDLYGKVITNSTTLSKVATSVNRLGDNFMSHLSKCSFLEQVEFCNFGIFYWKLIDSKIPSFQIAVTSKRQVRQSDQPVILLANAGFCLLVKHVATLDVLKQKTIHDQFLYQFTEKVGNMMCVPLIRICLFWQKNAVEDPDLFRICSRSLEIVKESRHYLTRDQAVIFFQGLTYVLRNIVQATRECSEKLEVFFQESSYIHKVFELLGLLIEDFHFVLKDGIESTYVMSICLDFLNLTEWPSEVLVQIIGLIGIATAHYMAPNMALLFENGVDTSLDLLGPLLRSKLLDKRPEVIKAALKVVFTVVNTSCSKSK